MRLYIAAIYTSNFGLHSTGFMRCPPQAQELRKQVRHHLESYHYIHKGKFADNIRRDGIKVFLDSGAFSSFSLGVDVDIHAYADWVKGNQDIIEMASVLDAIGDPVGTYHNQNTLEKLGAEVLPCFHFGEPLSLCEYYVKNYPYMTIGGMVPVPNNKLEIWLDEIWDKVLTDKDGIARTKVHGFGLTSRKLMSKYPWYSVDSSSWVQIAANGSIMLPEIQTAIATSSQSPKKKQFRQHFDSMPDVTTDYVRRILESYGLTVEQVQEDYRVRWALNAFSYDRLGRLMGDDHWHKPFRTQQETLF